MPLKNPNTKKAVDESMEAAKPATINFERLAADMSAARTKHDLVPDPAKAARDEERSQWRYALDRYGDVREAVELHPTLINDPDIQVALSAIRNAERAIKARAEELLGG